MVTKASKTTSFPASRKFVLRRDATVGTGLREVERVFGLPKGCVIFQLPSGKRARADKLIGALLKDWGW